MTHLGTSLLFCRTSCLAEPEPNLWATEAHTIHDTVARPQVAASDMRVKQHG